MDEKKKEQEIINVIGLKTPKTKEDDALEKDVRAMSDCPYNKCNGSGLLREAGSKTAKKCKCLKDKILEQKLENANINLKYKDKLFDHYDNETKYQLFIPKEKPWKMNKNIKDPKNEKVETYIKRNYEIKEDNRGLKEVMISYCKKNLELLNKGEDGVNLLLFGDPANGKTSFAIAAGLYFLNEGLDVYFTTTQNLIDMVFDDNNRVQEIAKTKDILILDELFNEYHSSNGLYAQKRLMEILKIREEMGLITICTSNGNPRDFELLYGKPFMSLINGTFFLFRLEREADGRVEKMMENYEKFNL